MEHPDTAVLLRVLIADLAAVVRRSVVHNQELKIGKRLGKHAFDGRSDELFHLVHRHNDTDFDCVIHSVTSNAEPGK